MTNRLLYAITGDKRFKETMAEIARGRKIDMFAAFDIYEKRGREEERINTERERKRADAAEIRADAAEERADKAEAEIARLREQLAALQQIT